MLTRAFAIGFLKQATGPEIEESAPDASMDVTMPPTPEPTPPVTPPEEKKRHAREGIRAIVLWARRRRECPPGKALNEDTGRCLPIKKASAGGPSIGGPAGAGGDRSGVVETYLMRKVRLMRDQKGK